MINKNIRNSINLWLSKMKYYQNLNFLQRGNIAKKILKLQYKIIGHGYHRIVYDLENGSVLKVATSINGINSNITEHHIYTQSPPHLLKYLSPVKAFGYGWLVMEKNTEKIQDDNGTYKNKLTVLRESFIREGIIPKDLKRGNLALSYEGEIIVIDYGNFQIIN
ncbi:hypothetical protein [Alkalihalobacterium elongatum]|uniref:hypothetical protein n=1 Tax=Alkalihalobacterium elongatum TaxID=2675466 RepID=UPI001C1F40AF|nr:hypothetical protein [Alkalihalobacterium elongatum]